MSEERLSEVERRLARLQRLFDLHRHDISKVVPSISGSPVNTSGVGLSEPNPCRCVLCGGEKDSAS